MAKNSSSSKTEHIPGPPILGALFGGGDYWQTTITKSDGKKVTGCGSTPEASQKSAAEKSKR